MDFRQLGVDNRLIAGMEAFRSRALFHEKMLKVAVVDGENVCAKLALAEGREAVLLLPALQWLAAGQTEDDAAPPRRILCVLPDRASAEGLAAAARVIAGGLGLETCVVTPPGEGEGAVEGPAAAPVLEGAPNAAFVAGMPESLLGAQAQGLLRLRDFGFLVLDGAERLADLPSETLRRLAAALLPPWERRAIVAASKLTVKAKSLAWDFADNPVEVEIAETLVKAQSVASETWYITAEEKLRFVLGLRARENPQRVCLFCNLKASAEESALRLRENGVFAEYIFGALPPERKFAILDGVKEVAGGVLVLTDDGAEGLAPGEFPIVVNYDIPLEPELYVRRLEMLDRGAPGARVINLACDRYVYGLPAIEDYIDAKLGARQVGPELLAAEDASEGLMFERPRFERDARGRSEGGAKVGRLVPVGASRQAGMEGAPRPAREGRRAQDGRSRGERDNAPDIRKRIADLTGGSLGEAPSRTGEGGFLGGEKRRAVAPEKAKAGHPKGRHDSHAAERGRKTGSPRPRKHAPVASGPTEIAGRGTGNPYDLPMEERMKLYREKYGRGLENSRESFRGKKGKAAGPQHVRPDGGTARVAGNAQKTKRHGALRPEAQRASDRPPALDKASTATPSPAPRESPGLLDRLVGLFRKKQE